jgi:hypothetical protein
MRQITGNAWRLGIDTWQKGMPSPHPGGRPRALHDVQELARQHTEAAIDTLAEIMHDEKAPHSARLSAAEALLARGWGGQFSRRCRHWAVARHSSSGSTNSMVQPAKPSTKRSPNRMLIPHSGGRTGRPDAVVGRPETCKPFANERAGIG